MESFGIKIDLFKKVRSLENVFKFMSSRVLEYAVMFLLVLCLIS